MNEPTYVYLRVDTPPHISISQFGRRLSQGDSTLLILGDIFSIHGKHFSSPNDPEILSTLFTALQNNTLNAWSHLKGQCSCIWINPDKIEIFRSALSPHLLFFSRNQVSDQLLALTDSPFSFSESYAKQFVLDLPTLQFSSRLTPFQGISRVPPASVVTLKLDTEPHIHLFEVEPYPLVEKETSFAETSEKLREQLKNILDWHLKKGGPVFAELSGGLDSSFVASFLSDLSPSPVRALMYAFRKHPSHRFSEECAQIVAQKKNIQLQVFDSSDIAPTDLAKLAPFQNEPVDLFWQGTLFGPICRDLVQAGSLLFTGFGCDQLLMRNNRIVQRLADQKGSWNTLPIVKDIARALNRPALNFSFQFLLSRLPEKTLVRLLDLTRSIKINPFKIDELLPEITKTERISWFVKNGAPLSGADLFTFLEEASGTCHFSLNYLIAPQYVIQPYLESKSVQYIHPFCDSRMIEFVSKEVPYHFIHDFKNPYKHLLREAMRGITPEEVRTRKKDEFSFDGYFFSVLKTNQDFLRSLLEEAARSYPDWIDSKSLLDSFESMLFGMSSNSESKLIRLMSYLIWKRNFTFYLKQTRGTAK
ncbi:MAG: asparagine synthase-related protein [Pseudomonadota bacterium]